MKTYKALIIENDRSIDDRLAAFIKDNAHLFSVTDIVVQARHYPEDVKEALAKGYDAIMGISTFTYKEQLENTVLQLDTVPIDYTIFFDDVCYYLNNFVSTNFGRQCESHWFKNYDKFMDVLKKWVVNCQVYEIYPDMEDSFIYDDFGLQKSRHPYRAILVQYDEAENFFYLDGQYERYHAKLKSIHRK